MSRNDAIILSNITEHVIHGNGGAGAPRRPAWALLAAHQGRLEEPLDQGLTVVKARELLAREGVVVPQRTMHRYALVPADDTVHLVRGPDLADTACE